MRPGRRSNICRVWSDDVSRLRAGDGRSIKSIRAIRAVCHRIRSAATNDGRGNRFRAAPCGWLVVPAKRQLGVPTKRQMDPLALDRPRNRREPPLQAYRRAEAAAHRMAEAQARKRAEAAAHRIAEAQAHKRAEAAAHKRAEAQANRMAEAQANRMAEAQARKRAEAQANRRAEAQAYGRADAPAHRMAEAQGEVIISIKAHSGQSGSALYSPFLPVYRASFLRLADGASALPQSTGASDPAGISQFECLCRMSQAGGSRPGRSHISRPFREVPRKKERNEIAEKWALAHQIGEFVPDLPTVWEKGQQDQHLKLYTTRLVRP